MIEYIDNLNSREAKILNTYVNLRNDTNNEYINEGLLDDAERIRLRDKCSGMYLLFLAPVLSASFKLLADMVIFMFSFLSQSNF